MARVTSTLAGTVTLPVLYSHLEQREFGVWVLLSGLVTLIAYADMGLGSAQTREVARAVASEEPRAARGVLAVGILWAACLCALAFLAVPACWPWLAGILRLGDLASPALNAVLVLLVGFTIASITAPWRAVLEGTQRYLPVAWADGCAAMLSALLSITVVLWGGGLVALAMCVVTANAARAFALVAVARAHAPWLTPRVRGLRRTDVKVALRYGLPVQLTNASAAALFETDRLLLAGFVGPTAVAGFEPGSKLAHLLRLPPALIMTAMFPQAATTAAAHEPARLNRLYLTLTRYVAVFAAVALAAMVVAADPLIRLWLGTSVPLAVMTLVTLSIGNAFHVTAVAAAIVTRAEGQPARETRYAVVAAALNLALTIPLIALLGPVGAPLSTAVAISTATGYFFLHFHRSSKRRILPLLRVLWPPALAAAAAGFLVWMATPYLPDGAGRGGAAVAVMCRGGLVVLLAGAFLLALRYFSAADRAWVRAALSRPRQRRAVTPAAREASHR